MAHFAEIDETNTVIRVVVVNNNELLVNGVELEAEGVTFCQSLFSGAWVQTSYNGNIRKNYAGIGYSYDQTRDAFIPPQVHCHAEETLDEATCLWVCTNQAHSEVVANGSD